MKMKPRRTYKLCTFIHKKYNFSPENLKCSVSFGHIGRKRRVIYCNTPRNRQ